MRIGDCCASPNSWITLSPKRTRSSALRTASTVVACWNRTWIRVPPEKSMPYLSPPCHAMWPSPARVTISEIAYAQRRLLMKSYFVLVKICIISSRPLIRASDGQRLEPPAALVDQVEDEAREEDRREQARHDADHQGDREALHRSGSELVQDDPGHDHRHVSVDDRRERALEACVDRRSDGLPEPELLTDALEDEDVRVDRHADRQHDPGDARQRQGRLEPGHRRQEDGEVEQERQVGDRAREPVVDQHEDEDGQGAGRRRDDALADRVGPQRGPDRALL